ncbi:MAG: PP2C family serine/threonine-protein phosphatase [Candidatus Poribacteria bacterium]
MNSQLRNKKTSSRLWKIASASVSGTRHEKMGQPCQDFHAWEVINGSILIAAVADGAGSALFGEIGSALAVQSAVKTLHESIAKSGVTPDNSHQLLIDSVESARTAIENKAQSESMTARDFATTLILLIATDGFVSAIQIGDGAVIIKDDNDGITALTKPSYGEFINETVFIVSPEAMDNMQIEIKRCRVSHIAVITDGLQMLALQLPDYTPFEAFFSPLFKFIAEVKDEKKANEQLISFLRSPRVAERVDDDLTLFLATIVEHAD